MERKRNEHVEKLNRKSKGAWREFVSEHPQQRIQHTLAFKKVIESSYSNLKPEYRLYFRSGKLRGVLPAFRSKNPLGERIVSMPFVDCGGHLGEFNYNILDNVIKERIEVRTNQLERIKVSGLKRNPRKEQIIIKLKKPEVMWKNVNRRLRTGVRKAKKSGLLLRKIEGREELKKFFGLYSKNMRGFGTPQHSFEFFKNIWKFLYPQNVRGVNCYKGDELAASIVGYLCGNYVYIIYNVSDPAYKRYRSNDLLYWTFMVWGFENNYKWFDMGQVNSKAEKGSHAHGLYKYKLKFGSERDVYEKYVYSNREVGAGSTTRIRGVWRRLPLFITKWAGPYLCPRWVL